MLDREVDCWVATSDPETGAPQLVPLSFVWDGRTVLLSTGASSPTGRALVATGGVRLGFGATRDVVMVDGAQNRRMTHGDRPDPGIDIVERIAAVADPELWVIALGTNDVGAEVTPERFGEDVKTVLAAIPADAPVVWVDVFIRDRQRQVETANLVLREMLAGQVATA